jgi:hypothetical protein
MVTQSLFIIILIFLLSFSIFNARYEKKHNNKSILQEKRVEKTIKTLSFLDESIRIIYDLFNGLFLIA